MDLETKCPHCDQWTALNVESCSKCGRLLHESKEEAATPISSFNKKWQLVIGLAVVALILSVIFSRHNPNSSQLGFYGQWDKDKDGYLKGTEIVAASTELNNAKVMVPDISGKLSMLYFSWEPARMDLDLDQRLSREELTRGVKGVTYHQFKEWDLNKDDLLSKAEFEKAQIRDITGTLRKPVPFESLGKFDLNQDGKLALLEIPPYHSFLYQFNLKVWTQGKGAIRRSESRPRKKQEEEKPDLSEQLGFYGQWDKDKDGYLKGTEIVAASTELNNVKVMAADLSDKLSTSNFSWEPPRMDLDLDQRLSREELTRGVEGATYRKFKEWDLNKDDLLSKAEFEKIPLAMGKNGILGKPAPFESLVKFDLNQDGKLALLEIPPYHFPLYQFNMKPKEQGNEQRERAEWRRKREEERSGNNNVYVGRGRPIIESMTLSTDTIIGGGEVTVTIKIRSEIPIVWLNKSLSGPMEDGIYGGGSGLKAREIRRGEWVYQWTDKISKFLPSGAYTYSGVSVRDEGRRRSEEWKDVSFRVINN